MKKALIFFCLLFVMLTLLLFVQTASASEKEYNINSVNIFVEINKDGSATVLENWNVTFKKGDFSRFFKTICYEGRKEKFSSLQTLWVKIDGKKCSYTEDIKSRPDNHYSLIRNGSVYTYSAYLKSSGITRNYEFSYVLKDVVKLVNSKDYYFTHRFFTNGFEKNIDKLDIYIYTPGEKNSVIKVVNTTEGKKHSGNKAEISASNVDGLFKVKVKIEKFTFDKLPKDSHIIDFMTYSTVWLIHLVLSLIFISFVWIKDLHTKINKIVLSILLFIPIANIIFFIYLALAEKKKKSYVRL